ncbi:MAG TPA: hypothetical protein VIA62_19110 [Thermoanaerobaculia bacterium]|jgi:hypothetical protein|nr:hypothetical protein [Thermoanaerobaculia bacterium]
MSTIDSLLAHFLSPINTLKHLDERGNNLFIRRDRDIDDAAEIAQILSHWIRLDLSFGVLWISLEDRALVVLTPEHLFLHCLAPATPLP